MSSKSLVKFSNNVWERNRLEVDPGRMIVVLYDKRERACMGTKLCNALHLSEKSSKYIACFHTSDFTAVLKQI